MAPAALEGLRVSEHRAQGVEILGRMFANSSNSSASDLPDSLAFLGETVEGIERAILTLLEDDASAGHPVGAFSVN
jgi:hypothetical protein